MLSRDYIQANLLYLSFKGKSIQGQRPLIIKDSTPQRGGNQVMSIYHDKYMLCNYYLNLKQRAILIQQTPMPKEKHFQQ